MFSITSTETRADERTTRAAVSAAKAIVENTVAAIEIANSPVVVETPDGVFTPRRSREGRTQPCRYRAAASLDRAILRRAA